jgi:3-hydroxyacyl-CoA dehydrogenase
MFLLQNNVADVGDIDMAMENGPGLRWGAMGPSLLLDLGGGPGGARQYADKFMDGLMSWYAPADPDVNEALVDRWVTETMDEAKQASRSALENMRDERLIALLNIKNSTTRLE